MAVNKVTINAEDGERVLVDLTADSVSEETLFEGETAHAANGEEIVGTFTLENEMSEQGDLIEQIKTALQGKAVGSGSAFDVTAEVGQTIIVKEVDENGKPVAWEAADVIQTTEQTFTEEEKEQARVNIGAERATTTVSIDAPTTLSVENETEYWLTNVSNLTITYPTGSFECYIHLTTSAGEITVVFPESKYIGSAPSFAESEEWEISIKDGVVVSGQVVSA